MITDFEGCVNSGGLLLKALYDTKDNLPWFDASGHTPIVTAMQDVLQACKIRLMCWQQIAMLKRYKGDVSGYNQAQYEVILQLARVPNLITEMQMAVMMKIQATQQARIAGLSVKRDTQDTANFTSHRRHSDDNFRVRGWIEDPASKRHIFQSGLQDAPTGSKVLDGIETFFLYALPVIIIDWDISWANDASGSTREPTAAKMAKTLATSCKWRSQCTASLCCRLILIHLSSN